MGSFLVILYHFGIHEAPGGLGVLVFFVLSGFLITWLMLEENETTGSVSLRDFYARRFSRILPALYGYSLLLLAVLLVLDKRIVWPQVIASVLCVSNYYQAIHGDPNTGFSHTWSLGVEAQFYLLWPLAFLWLRKNPVRMAKALAWAILAVWVYRGVLCFMLGVPQEYVYEAFDTRADHLMVGCVLAVILRSGMFPAVWSVVCRGPLMGLPTLGLLGLSAVLRNLGGPTYRDTVGFIVNPILSAILMTQLIALRGSALWGWLNWPWVRYLGRISYSIYLYQQILVEPSKEALADYPLAVQIGGCMAAVVGMASLSHYLIERPFLKRKGRAQRAWPASSLPVGTARASSSASTAGAGATLAKSR